ncbi:MAG: pyrroline-5-carboxylate reductase [Actinobacteria bacterium RBG_19FT_COMBO_54_7]|uniref:Pyrroline-5-carboxylate reductase n=1 Tax=Candidatus Solincola sediminis TaxID=1797199 RepID=A0A1F2WGT0_9ACTN|nr:MAG: pyrroline-5-carboxylate reductase [Candidatus Solincola sediminis]OFW58305.1 MAG: pyrroline-5-carboxylate reductase [Candidatus Solincola sediminis]OFW67668.1 MAG: pyrroline-5-carboxylate reductase [Actinobacteria bacterium RBG_19FT_COMBO_54_7]
MAEAIIKQLLQGGWASPEEVIISDVDSDRLNKMVADYGVEAASSNQAAAENVRIILLSVKPQKLETVLTELAVVVTPRQIVISIAMGKSTQFIETLLPPDVQVVRVMPNNPAMVGSAVSVISYGRFAREEAREAAMDIFSFLGEAYELDESLQDQAMALSGCGPAYFYIIAEALCDAAVKLGLDRALALKLASGTMIGSGRMLAESGMNPSALKDMVTSPGGSTIAALEMLEQNSVRAAFYEALTAAWKRAKEV